MKWLFSTGLFQSLCRLELVAVHRVQYLHTASITLYHFMSRLMLYVLVVVMVTVTSWHMDSASLYVAVGMVLALRDGFFLRSYAATLGLSEVVTTSSRLKVEFKTESPCNAVWL